MIIFLTIISVFVIYFLRLMIFNSKLDKELLDSHSLETIWTVIPMIVLGFIAYPSLTMLYFMEAREGSQVDLSINVVAHQWYWEYEINNNRFDSALSANPKTFYTLETNSRLDLPLHKLIGLFISSRDVLHAFTIPRFGIKVDAIPGRRNVLYLNLNTPGKYFGQCSEICGANHSFIPIECTVGNSN